MTYIARCNGVEYQCKNRVLSQAKKECAARFYPSQRIVIYDTNGEPVCYRPPGGEKWQKAGWTSQNASDSLKVRARKQRLEAAKTRKKDLAN